MPPMTGGGEPDGGDIRETDEGRGTFLPRAAEGKGSVQGGQGGGGGWIYVRTHEDTT